MHLVQQRSSNILSLQNQVWRNTGAKLSCNAIKRLDASFAVEAEPLTRRALHSTWHVIQALDREIGEIERTVKAQVKLRDSFRCLLTAPGIGFVLASSIMLETGDIGRFAGPGNFASYCRCVDSTHTSNNKKKGEGNRKSGNRYLAWAFVEAAHFARRYCPPAQRFFERKQARTNVAIASKALAHKLARACYFLMRDGVEFNVKKCFA
jgi:transposase